jgi:hypothetical protein
LETFRRRAGRKQALRLLTTFSMSSAGAEMIVILIASSLLLRGLRFVFFGNTPPVSLLRFFDVILIDVSIAGPTETEVTPVLVDRIMLKKFRFPDCGTATTEHENQSANEQFFHEHPPFLF